MGFLLRVHGVTELRLQTIAGALIQFLPTASQLHPLTTRAMLRTMLHRITVLL